MLSRVAASLYWLGRYVERAEFAARLIEATVRLDALSSREDGEAAWRAALAITGAASGFAASGERDSPRNIARFMSLARDNPASVVAALDRARDNAKAVRTALSRDAWSTLNRAWMLFSGRASPGDTQATLRLMEEAQGETLAFEGAVGRMLRTYPKWFIQLGVSVERGDATARLLDEKSATLIPAHGDAAGHHHSHDRDEWTAVLQTVGAVNAFRALYREGLQPAHVVDMLILRPELPRSFAATSAETVRLLGLIGRETGMQGEADRRARARGDMLEDARRLTADPAGLHAFLDTYVADTAALHHAIARQFRFV